MKIEEKAVEILRHSYVCDRCLGRQFGSLLSGYSNEQRGKEIRKFLALAMDSGEKIDVEYSNFNGIKFRNVKIKPGTPGKCGICGNFFVEKMAGWVKKISDALKDVEFRTFQMGTVVSDDLLKREDKLWESTNIDFVEPLKSEINRELGKLVEKATNKKFAPKNPDVVILVNMKTGKDEFFTTKKQEEIEDVGINAKKRGNSLHQSGDRGKSAVHQPERG